jgi:formyltetrahydrofolate-dependent phosphoribosylglycinamide formyltransferase
VSYRVAVAVSGRGSNLLALCDAQLEAAEVVLVLSDRDAPAFAAAQERGIATHRLARHQDGAEWLRMLAEHRVDLLVLAGYLKLIPRDVVAAYRGRVINIHPALLPRHGGPGMYGERVHRAVLASGDLETGATVHLADEEYDRGAILGQARVPVHATDTWEQVAARVLTAEHRLLPAAVLAAARAGHPVPFDFPPAA